MNIDEERIPIPGHDPGAEGFTERLARHYRMPSLTPDARARFDRGLARRLLRERATAPPRAWVWPALACGALGAAAALALWLATPLETSAPSEAPALAVESPTEESVILDQPEIVLLSLASEDRAASSSYDDDDASLPSDYEAIARLLL